LFFVCFLSPLVWFFLWLPEEVLTLLFLLHRENRDFSILMKDICLKLQAHFYILVYNHFWDLMKLVGSCGSLSLLFVMNMI
jgi:hypothetical protein